VGSELDDPSYVQMIEDMGGLVVADDLCTGSKYFWNLAEEDGDALPREVLLPARLRLVRTLHESGSALPLLSFSRLRNR